MTLRLAVVGPAPDAGRWRDHAAAQGLEPEFHDDPGAALAALAAGGGDRALVVRGPALLGLDVAAEAGRAASDPGVAGLRWLALASDGLTIDGRELDNGSYADHAALGARHPHRALAGGDPAVTLLDLDALRSLPPDAAGVAEAVARGWGAGLPSYVSPHLRFAFPGTRAEYRAHRRAAGPPPDVRDALRAARPEPTVTVAIRSALRRPAMLARAAASVAAQAGDLAQVLLVSTEPGVDEAAAGIGAEPVAVATGEVPVRAALVTAALEAATSDYVWFVDDDDALAPGAVRAARDAVHAAERPLLVGAAVEVEEQWPPGATEPAAATETRRYDPGAWTGALTGWMPVPFPSLVIPRDLARRRLAEVPLRVGLGEDYALLLALLTAPGAQVVTVDADFARVSIRPGGDNVVTAIDRTEWVRSAATMLGDLAADPHGGAPVPWSLGERVRDSVPLASLPAGEAEPAWKARLKQVVPAGLHPAARRVLARARGREHLDAAGLAAAAAGRVLLMPAVPYHVEELAPLAAALAGAGAQPAFLVSDHRWPGLRRLLRSSPFPAYRCLPPGPWVEGAAALLTMNDWAEIYRDVVVAGNEAGVPTFGKVEGVQDFADDDVSWSRRAYRTVSRVLAQGENDKAALAGVAVEVVGSSRLEAMWLAPPRPPGGDVAVVNFNFTYGVLGEAAEPWLRSAVAGCEAAGLRPVVSVHHAAAPPSGVAVARAPIAELLEEAAVLVSRFSTVPFEAMARGVPFVYHNPHGERVPTFHDAAGAFETSVDTTGLAAGIRAVREWDGRYRERCAPFFLRQVDVDPARSAAQRGAAAIVAATGGGR